MRKTKIRGLKRKINAVISRIHTDTEDFPTTFHQGYWHLPLPVAYDFITSPNTPLKVKKRCVQTLVDRAVHLMETQPNDGNNYRVVVGFDPPSLWGAQIIVFQGDSYYGDFFKRDDEFQKWLPLPSNRNIVEEWALNLPDGWEILSFKETILNDDGSHTERELWFAGEFN
ncbi:DUF3916 domain-containing protein [Bacillus sp. KH172YL63]|uniref:DUF3916 domain-containing protein n=1 Tax=Bacillus sp. KH172YL63 TaxID=2709784 RepID=UPI0013E4F60C|nr:DUF3916 domain-containing protein [Bacillus sp. KH172YL63]BCB03989.1 hypothetical protein KH172YL63_21220 [Bacillus sp. KH172YL63]